MIVTYFNNFCVQFLKIKKCCQTKIIAQMCWKNVYILKVNNFFEKPKIFPFYFMHFGKISHKKCYYQPIALNEIPLYNPHCKNGWGWCVTKRGLLGPRVLVSLRIVGWTNIYINTFIFLT
jgi:hypothetical protein